MCTPELVSIRCCQTICVYEPYIWYRNIKLYQTAWRSKLFRATFWKFESARKNKKERVKIYKRKPAVFKRYICIRAHGSLASGHSWSAPWTFLVGRNTPRSPMDVSCGEETPLDVSCKEETPRTFKKHPTPKLVPAGIKPTGDCMITYQAHRRLHDNKPSPQAFAW